MSTQTKVSPRVRALKVGLVTTLFIAGLVLIMLWLIGAFRHKVSESSIVPTDFRPVGDTPLEAARLIRVPVEESSVGTVRPVHEASVASKLLAKVVEVTVKAGDSVQRGDLLVRLDDENLKARALQMAAALDGARTARDQAVIEFQRVQRLREQDSASQLEFDRATTALKTAEAALNQAAQQADEAQIILSYAKITSPLTGLVVDKKVSVGDTVTPGQTLLTLYDHTQMQLVASVRESLSRRLAVDQAIPVQVDAIGIKCEGRISEIVPESEAASRSFLVKVTGPCPPGVHAGMFGRVLIPLDEQEVLVIPAKAVRSVGQLSLVDVAADGVLQRRAVQLGRSFDDNVEVLSGLHAGEMVAVAPGKSAAK